MFPKCLLLLFIVVIFNTSYFFQMGRISCLIPISHRKQSTNNQAKQPRGSVNLGSRVAHLAELGALKLPLGGLHMPRRDQGTWTRPSWELVSLPKESSLVGCSPYGLLHSHSPICAGYRWLSLQHEGSMKNTSSPSGATHATHGGWTRACLLTLAWLCGLRVKFLTRPGAYSSLPDRMNQMLPSP